MADIPDSDTEFSTYGIDAVNYISANNAGKWDIDPALLQLLVDAQNLWLGNLTAHNAAQQAALAATQAKDDARYLKPNGFEVLLRMFRNMIAAHPNTTGADRAALGLPDADNPPSPPPPLTSHPDPMIKKIDRLEATLGTVDSESGKRAKPAGVKQIEVRMAITAQGAAIPPINTFVYEAMISSASFHKEFEPEDAGKVAHFIFRYVKTDGTFSAYGPTISVTIQG